MNKELNYKIIKEKWSSIKTKELLKEELKDISKYPHNIHYTNLSSLIEILKTGYLRGNRYMYSANTGKEEVATLRRGEDKTMGVLKRKNEKEHADKMSSLSRNIGDVKIYLFTDRIKAGARGISIKPVAELNIATSDHIDHYLKEIYKKNLGLKDNPKFEDFCNKVLEIIKKQISINEELSQVPPELLMDKEFDKEMFGYLKSFGVSEERYHRAKYTMEKLFPLVMKVSKKYKYSREAEERFAYDKKKSKGIPVKPEFMKIRITDFNEEHSEKYKKIAVYMKANPSLFMRGTIFDKIVKLAD